MMEKSTNVVRSGSQRNNKGFVRGYEGGISDP